MAKILTLPKLSVVMKEGTVINWYFKEGYLIKRAIFFMMLKRVKWAARRSRKKRVFCLKFW